ncbi:MAG TPA: DinB family protein [Casimicrobiaceae bacterium]
MVGSPCTYPPFGADMFASFDELSREREATDKSMLEWAANVSAEWLAAPLTYTSLVDGNTRRLPAAVAAIHMFNHGTHHRGQLTTLLKQGGIDPGVTDLPWLPGVATMK